MSYKRNKCDPWTPESNKCARGNTWQHKVQFMLLHINSGYAYLVCGYVVNELLSVIAVI